MDVEGVGAEGEGIVSVGGGYGFAEFAEGGQDEGEVVLLGRGWGGTGAGGRRRRS